MLSSDLTALGLEPQHGSGDGREAIGKPEGFLGA
jgi:hypothetical protein